MIVLSCSSIAVFYVPNLGNMITNIHGISEPNEGIVTVVFTLCNAVQARTCSLLIYYPLAAFIVHTSRRKWPSALCDTQGWRHGGCSAIAPFIAC